MALISIQLHLSWEYFFFVGEKIHSCLWHLRWFLSISKCYSILFLCRPRRHFLISEATRRSRMERGAAEVGEAKKQSRKLPHTITKDKRFPLRIFNRNLCPYFVWQNFMAFAFDSRSKPPLPLPLFLFHCFFCAGGLPTVPSLAELRSALISYALSHMQIELQHFLPFPFPYKFSISIPFVL